jgi:hypothetical protein
LSFHAIAINRWRGGGGDKIQTFFSGKKAYKEYKVTRVYNKHNFLKRFDCILCS